jgi:lycopene cyclase domain-containing protein
VSALQFVLLFLLAPSALLLASLGNRLVERTAPVIAVIAAAALIYMVPWAHAWFAAGIWDWGLDTSQGDVWGVPLEAYAFFVLQAVFTGALTVIVSRRLGWKA